MGPQLHCKKIFYTQNKSPQQKLIILFGIVIGVNWNGFLVNLIYFFSTVHSISPMKIHIGHMQATGLPVCPPKSGTRNINGGGGSEPAAWQYLVLVDSTFGTAVIYTMCGGSGSGWYDKILWNFFMTMRGSDSNPDLRNDQTIYLNRKKCLSRDFRCPRK